MQRLKLSASFAAASQAPVSGVKKHFFKKPRLEHKHHVQGMQ
jgi:hypothetical protein